MADTSNLAPILAQDYSSIWLVWQGHYSDARVIAAYSTKEGAEAHVARLTEAIRHPKNPYADPDADIQHISLDLPVDQPLFGSVVLIQMDRDGHSVGHYKGPSIDAHGSVLTRWRFSNHLQTGETFLNAWVPSDTCDRAVKITNELRTRLIAQELWGSNDVATTEHATSSFYAYIADTHCPCGFTVYSKKAER